MPPRSAILSLPDPVRAELDRRLISGGFQDYRGLSGWLQEQGYEIGKTAVHNYGSTFERKIAALKVATDQARAMADTAPDDEGKLSEAVIAMVQANMFDVLVNLQEADEETDPAERLKLLGGAARAAADAGRAAVSQKKHRLEIENKARAAADEVAKLARKGGLSPESVEAIRSQILGIAA